MCVCVLQELKTFLEGFLNTKMVQDIDRRRSTFGYLIIFSRGVVLL